MDSRLAFEQTSSGSRLRYSPEDPHPSFEKAVFWYETKDKKRIETDGATLQTPPDFIPLSEWQPGLRVGFTYRVRDPSYDDMPELETDDDPLPALIEINKRVSFQPSIYYRGEEQCLKSLHITSDRQLRYHTGLHPGTKVLAFFWYSDAKGKITKDAVQTLTMGEKGTDPIESLSGFIPEQEWKEGLTVGVDYGVEEKEKTILALEPDWSKDYQVFFCLLHVSVTHVSLQQITRGSWTFGLRGTNSGTLTYFGPEKELEILFSAFIGETKSLPQWEKLNEKNKWQLTFQLGTCNPHTNAVGCEFTIKDVADEEPTSICFITGKGGRMFRQHGDWQLSVMDDGNLYLENTAEKEVIHRVSFWKNTADGKHHSLPHECFKFNKKNEFKAKVASQQDPFITPAEFKDGLTVGCDFPKVVKSENTEDSKNIGSFTLVPSRASNFIVSAEQKIGGHEWKLALVAGRMSFYDLILSLESKVKATTALKVQRTWEVAKHIGTDITTLSAENGWKVTVKDFVHRGGDFTAIHYKLRVLPDDKITLVLLPSHDFIAKTSCVIGGHQWGLELGKNFVFHDNQGYDLTLSLLSAQKLSDSVTVEITGYIVTATGTNAFYQGTHSFMAENNWKYKMENFIYLYGLQAPSFKSIECKVKIVEETPPENTGILCVIARADGKTASTEAVIGGYLWFLNWKDNELHLLLLSNTRQRPASLPVRLQFTEGFAKVSITASENTVLSAANEWRFNKTLDSSEGRTRIDVLLTILPVDACAEKDKQKEKHEKDQKMSTTLTITPNAANSYTAAKSEKIGEYLWSLALIAADQPHPFYRNLVISLKSSPHFGHVSAQLVINLHKTATISLTTFEFEFTEKNNWEVKIPSCVHLDTLQAADFKSISCEVIVPPQEKEKNEQKVFTLTASDVSPRQLSTDEMLAHLVHGRIGHSFDISTTKIQQWSPALSLGGREWRLTLGKSSTCAEKLDLGLELMGYSIAPTRKISVEFTMGAATAKVEEHISISQGILVPNFITVAAARVLIACAIRFIDD